SMSRPVSSCAMKRSFAISRAARAASLSPAALAALAFVLAVAAGPAAARATTAAPTIACNPCAGVTTGAAHEVVDALQQAPHLAKDARFYARWRHEALGDWDPAPAQNVASTGATPWVQVAFHTPAPLVEHAPELERELAGLAAVARNPGPVLDFE